MTEAYDPPELRDLLKKSMRRSRRAVWGSAKTEKHLSEAAKRAAEKLDCGKRDDAMLLLDELAEQLGVTFDPEDVAD